MGDSGTEDKVAGVTVRRSARARRLSLRVSRLDGRVTLTLPRGVSEREGARFLDERADWIRQVRGGLSPEVSVGPGATLPVSGERLRLIAADGRGVRRRGDALDVPARRAGPAVRAWLQREARSRILPLVHAHADRLGVRAGKLTLRDTRSRWGSCNHRGDLMLSWRLVMAPPEVLDYVVSHEVAHIVHMDHSARFWTVVERLCPDWRAHRDWLRREGETLHRYRFDTQE